MTLERGALAGLVLSTAAVGAAYAGALAAGGAPGWAPWSMAGGIAGAVVSLMALGAARDGSVGSLAWPFAGVFVVLAGGFGTLLAMPPHAGPEAPLWLGLPPRTAVLLYGIGGLLLLFVPVSYALTFERLTLDDDDWDRVRRAVRESSPGDRDPARAGPAADGPAGASGARPDRAAGDGSRDGEAGP